MSERPLSPAAEQALACVLDAIVPARDDGRLPAAGALGLVAPVSERLGDAAPLVAQGLAALEERAVARGASGLAALEPGDRAELLEEFATQQPAFLPLLSFHTYTAYYQHPRVLEALGLEARPPYPGGYELEPGDLSLLDRVRERPRLYRETGEAS